jgi:putative thioredoxin
MEKIVNRAAAWATLLSAVCERSCALPSGEATALAPLRQRLTCDVIAMLRRHIARATRAAPRVAPRLIPASRPLAAYPIARVAQKAALADMRAPRALRLSQLPHRVEATERAASSGPTQAAPKPPKATGASSGASTAGSALPLVVEVTEQNLQQVIASSAATPLVLDCYATWCEPCRVLAPRIEAAVKRQGGKVRLAKMDVDKFQDVAAELQVQALPTVVAIANGAIVGRFTGVRSEEDLSKFCAQLANLASAQQAPAEESEEAPAPAETPDAASADPTSIVARGLAILDGNGDTKAAAQLFASVLEKAEWKDEHHPRALAGLITVALREKDGKLAVSLADRIKSEFPKAASTGEIGAALASAALFDEISKLPPGTAADFAALARSEPTNALAHLYNQALRLLADGKQDAATDVLLDVVKRDRAWNDSAARKLLLKVFAAQGSDSAAVKRGRQRLMNVLAV